jgi:16S rRNA (guanine527-N7)-methyltransferase
MSDGRNTKTPDGRAKPSRTNLQKPDFAKDRAEALRLVPVSRETSGRFDQSVALLLEWQRNINLIAPSTLPHLWTRHIADSAQLLRLAPDAKVWIDLGSGAGFPGVVIACMLADREGAIVHLVESNAKKCAFLREAIRQLQLPAVVHCERIEQFSEKFTDEADVVTARALAPLDRLLPLAAPLLKSRGVGLFPKGQDVEAELTAASKCWNIQATLEPSVTSSSSSIVVVRKLELRPGGTKRT